MTTVNGLRKRVEKLQRELVLPYQVCDVERARAEILGRLTRILRNVGTGADESVPLEQVDQRARFADLPLIAKIALTAKTGDQFARAISRGLVEHGCAIEEV